MIVFQFSAGENIWNSLKWTIILPRNYCTDILLAAKNAPDDIMSSADQPIKQIHNSFILPGAED